MLFGVFMNTNQIIANAVKVKRRLMNRVIEPTPPTRSERIAAYERKMEDYRQKVIAVSMILSRLAKSWKYSINQLNNNPDYVREIKITSYAIILCGKSKYVPVMMKDINGKIVPSGELTRVPTCDKFREEVLLLIDCFYDRVGRGGIGQGASTWRPKREPRLSEASVEILLTLADTYKNLFDQVKEALLGKEPENMIDKISFDVFVDEEKIKCLIDKLME